jgi:hypothetical protein
MADLQRLQTNCEYLETNTAEAAATPFTLPEVATPKETAQYVKSTEQALAQDRYLKRGLPYVKFGGRVRYLRQDVLDYLAANRVTPAVSRD